MERPSLLGTWAFASSTACSLRRCSHRREDKQKKGLTGEWTHTDTCYPTVPWPSPSPAQGRHSRTQLRGHTLPRQGPPRRHPGGGSGARYGPAARGGGRARGEERSAAAGMCRGGPPGRQRAGSAQRCAAPRLLHRAKWTHRVEPPPAPSHTHPTRRLGRAARQRSGDPQLPVPLQISCAGPPALAQSPGEWEVLFDVGRAPRGAGLGRGLQ